MQTTHESRRARSNRIAEVAQARKKKQLILIACLMIVILFALVARPIGESSDRTATLVSPTLNINPVGESRTQASEDDPVSRFVQVVELPRLSTEQIRQADLFQQPSVAPIAMPVLIEEEAAQNIQQEVAEAIDQVVSEGTESEVPEIVEQVIVESTDQQVSENTVPEVAESVEQVDVEDLVDDVAEAIEVQPAKSFHVGAVYGAFDSNSQSALIDGQIRRAGERLEGGVQILSVTAEGVRVSQ